MDQDSKPGGGRPSTAVWIALIAAGTVIVLAGMGLFTFLALRREAASQKVPAPLTCPAPSAVPGTVCPPAPAPVVAGQPSGVLPALPGPVPPIPAVPAGPDPAAAASLQQLLALIAGPVGAEECGRLKRSAGVPPAICRLLVEAIREGKTRKVTRVALRRELTERGYLPLRGYVIARQAQGLYEITRLGRRTHALLRTEQPRIIRGYFSIWARRAGSWQVTRRDGSQQTWDEFQEDAFGAAIPAIFTVREGEMTREVARNALRALLVTSLPPARPPVAEADDPPRPAEPRAPPPDSGGGRIFIRVLPDAGPVGRTGEP